MREKKNKNRLLCSCIFTAMTTGSEGVLYVVLVGSVAGLCNEDETRWFQFQPQLFLPLTHWWVMLRSYGLIAPQAGTPSRKHLLSDYPLYVGEVLLLSFIPLLSWQLLKTITAARCAQRRALSPVFHADEANQWATNCEEGQACS